MNVLLSTLFNGMFSFEIKEHDLGFSKTNDNQRACQLP